MTRQKPSFTKPSRNDTGPVLAREREVAKAEAINGLLTQPIAILPKRIGDPVRPFALGLWNEIRSFLKPEISVSKLRKAVGTYVHSRSYHVAVARPDSIRHDINGMPAGSISEADRLDAQRKYESFKVCDGSRSRTPPAHRAPLSKSEIRAALLMRSETLR